VSVIERREVWPDGTIATAIFDETERYRYLLTRTFPKECGSGIVTFVMLNPSIADALRNDATVTRCSGYARRWGYASLEVVNIFALRTADPRKLKRIFDPSGGLTNEDYIVESCKRADFVVAGWGAHGKLKEQAGHICWLLHRNGVELNSLGVTATGEPRHPLYLRGDAAPTTYVRTGARRTA
jgi:hypothetical protein